MMTRENADVLLKIKHDKDWDEWGDAEETAQAMKEEFESGEGEAIVASTRGYR